MSLTYTLQTALTGLNSAQRALGTTANNVANANTDGFSRKEVHQSTRIIEGEGYGVDTEEATRIVDEFLDVEIRKQLGFLGRSNALSDVLDQVEMRVFGAPGDGDRGLSNKFADFTASIEAVATSPENAATRSTMMAELEDMLNEIDGNATAVQGLRGDVDRQIKSTIDSINGDIQRLDHLNQQFARAIPTAELLDQRDQVLEDLAGKIDIGVFTHENNTIAVYTANGEALLEYGPKKLIYTPAASVTDSTAFRSIDVYDYRQIDAETGLPKAGETGSVLVSSGLRMDLTPELANDAIADSDQIVVSPLRTGKLQGLLEARDRKLPQLADQISEIATMVRYNVNKAHNNAMPYPLPTEFSGTRSGFADFDAAAGTGTATGIAHVAVFAADGTLATDISLDMSTYPSAVDLVTDLNTQLGGFGSATITADNRLEITMGNDVSGQPYGVALSEDTSSIAFTDNNGRDWNYGFAHYFGLNDLIVQDGTKTTELSVRPDISSDQSRIGQAILDYSTGTAEIGGAGDNRGLQNLAAAVRSDFTTIDRGGLAGRTTTIVDYISDVIGAQASDAAEADNRAASNQALTDELLQRQSSISGVNLDEELSKLIIYQRAYTVSARVMTVTNELFDELMNVGR
ncbi:MAG: flagellar hook-associated protein FlgK [Geminicoccaceae bacterium]|nr:flagellar hook-associated protein FlgK [Geminicoccaceae bacterium]MCB9945099.1 flagellar hook-associated protein FlgK [Geminicoccaceae bacterium]